MIILGWIIAMLAMVILVIAAVGILRLPDALSRQHAATKAATLSVSLFLLALLVISSVSGWGWDWILRLLAILAFLLITLPLASHAIARAGVQELKNPHTPVNGSEKTNFHN